MKDNTLNQTSIPFVHVTLKSSKSRGPPLPPQLHPRGSQYVKNAQSVTKDKNNVAMRMKEEFLDALPKQESPLVRRVRERKHVPNADEAMQDEPQVRPVKTNYKFASVTFPKVIHVRENNDRFTVYDDVLTHTPHVKRKPTASSVKQEIFTPYPTMDDLTRRSSSMLLNFQKIQQHASQQSVPRRMDEHITGVINEYGMQADGQSYSSQSSRSTPATKRPRVRKQLDMKKIDSIITAREAKTFKEQWDKFAAENKFVGTFDNFETSPESLE